MLILENFLGYAGINCKNIFSLKVDNRNNIVILTYLLIYKTNDEKEIYKT